MNARRLVTLLASGLAAGAAALGIVLAGAGGAATAARPPERGVVVVETDLGYQGGQAAGTGVVIAADGKVLTNNHVVRGATAIRVVVPSTGRAYRASVAGYSIASDIALLRLSGASGLATVVLGSSAGIGTGQRVTAVGNAGGTGRIVTATGTITALGRTITAQDDEGGAQQMRGLVQTDAALQPGDSGGPLLDGAGRVIGIDSAASATFSFGDAAAEGYAIPIDRALALARQILSGRTSSTVHIGATAWLGVSVQPLARFGSAAGAVVVSGVVAGGPADRAGVEQGDVITSVGGRTVGSANELIAELQGRKPGTTIRLALSDAFGSARTTTVRLGSGPPQ